MRNHDEISFKYKTDICNKMDDLNKYYLPVFFHKSCNRIMIDILTKIIQSDYTPISRMDSIKDNLFALMFIIDSDKNIVYGVFMDVGIESEGKGVIESAEIHVIPTSVESINGILNDVDFNSYKINIVCKTLINLEDIMNDKLEPNDIKFNTIQIGDKEDNDITSEDILFNMLHIMITARNMIDSINENNGLNLLDVIMKNNNSLKEAYDIENKFTTDRSIMLNKTEGYGEKEKIDYTLFKHLNQLLVISILDRILNDNNVKEVPSDDIFDDILGFVGSENIICMVINIDSNASYMGYRYNDDIRVIKTYSKSIVDKITLFLKSENDDKEYYTSGVLVTNPYDEDPANIGLSSILSIHDYKGNPFMDGLRELTDKLKKIYLRKGE